MADGDGWICLNDDKKKVKRMRLKTEKKELTGRIQFPRRKGMDVKAGKMGEV